MKKHKFLSGLVVLSLGITGSIGGWAATEAAEVKHTYSASEAFQKNIQGAGQWYYEKLSGTAYLDLAYDQKTKRWAAPGGYPWISATALHPDQNFDAVRKWVSPGKGTISISGSVKKESAAGDGVIASIKKDGVKLWSATIKNTTAVTPQKVTKIPVKVGTEISFIVNKAGNMNHDHVLWEPKVVYQGTAATTNSTTGAAVKSKTGITAKSKSLPYVSVLDYGAKPNDSKDDYAAFVAAIDAAKASGKYVHVPAGNYRLSNILTIDGVKVQGAGKFLTTLTSTNPKRGSIDLKGNGVQLSNLKHAYQTTVPRGDGSNEKNNITVRGAKNFKIQNVYVSKSSTAGIMVTYGASNGIIRGNTVDSTGADGIHMTGASQNITVENNIVRKAGDDTIAVVSYTDSDVNPVNQITIRKNHVGYGSKARGIAVVGGNDVNISNNSIQDTSMAGVYVAVEASYNTRNVNRVNVTNNLINHTGTAKPQNHPNVLVYASQGTIDNVVFTGNTIKNGAHRGIGVWGNGTIKNITFNKNTLINRVGKSTTFVNGNIKLNQNVGF
ncbi:right-handed parallel beta-helix repeat-containing protein [Saccharibacillus sp. JS10]|uniref:right-handed parallel beta-helix repeat-containing protein n=1 Tax=Saccharibacillus sp. JS10 TaxID=2950552 RepID=UPI00210A1BE8|nr:right-handed parallel beta-helix repeat-containing protein [Saccharibacillus sp. JS10]MCQ4085225.1 right-handed parallel beta-helix repeat-containing protein [Saccharibacillus sp. JS10]